MHWRSCHLRFETGLHPTELSWLLRWLTQCCIKNHFRGYCVGELSFSSPIPETWLLHTVKRHVDARGQRLRKSLIEYPQRPTNNCLLILMFALDAHLHLKIQSNSFACPLPIINLRWMYKTRLGTSHQQRHIRMQPSHNSAQRVQTGWN